ncbi:hypothetical protein PV325_013215 [Microctonus aethiopoides]|nr:hypothetical protein PV325_013215 [Microctonus aethiopoides]
MGGGAAVSGQPTAPRVRITSDISVGLPTGDINGTKSMSLALHNSGTIPQTDILLLTGRWTGVACTDRST